MTGGIIAAIIIAALALIIIIWWVTTLNKFRTMLVKIDESESGIDVALTKRFDVLTKMLGAVKGYTKHEKETLEGVISMRAPQSNMSIEDKSKYSAALDDAAKTINVVVERYPDLKADKNFSILQDSISEVEEHLQAARRIYNQNVSRYNKSIIVFPASIVAGAKYTKRDFFEAEDAKRKDVEISF